MYTLLQLNRVEWLTYEQAPAVRLAWIIAELFHKYHSFSLECATFLATGFVVDALVQKILRPLVTR